MMVQIRNGLLRGEMYREKVIIHWAKEDRTNSSDIHVYAQT
jgi:hypothetical protein